MEPSLSAFVNKQKVLQSSQVSSSADVIALKKDTVHHLLSAEDNLTWPKQLGIAMKTVGT